MKRINRWATGLRLVVTRATALPAMVRAGIGVSFVIALYVAWPTTVTTSRYSPLLTLVGFWPAFAPRGRAATTAALTVVAGWMADTVWFDARIELWRVLTIAATLYIGHTLAALAAVLPYDAIVNLDVVGAWAVRALVVVLVSSTLTVVALGLSADVAGQAFLLATLAGLGGAAGLTLLLARLIRRP